MKQEAAENEQRHEKALAVLKQEEIEAEIRIEEAKLKAKEEEENDERFLALDDLQDHNDKAEQMSSFSDHRISPSKSPIPPNFDIPKYPTYHDIPQTASPVNHNSSNDNNHPKFIDISANYGLADLTHALNINRLPIPEPPIFHGNPLEYPNWICAFEALIENKSIHAIERIHYLNKYLGGKAKASVSGYFILRSENAYQQARELLEKRFGNPFIISEEFQKKLETWPKLQPKDNKGLLDFSDFINQCQIASTEIPNLSFLNDMREIGKIANKLPESIVHRWRRTCAKVKEEKGKYPNFLDFSQFISKESELANDPVINRDFKKITINETPNRYSANVLATSTDNHNSTYLKSKNCAF